MYVVLVATTIAAAATVAGAGGAMTIARRYYVIELLKLVGALHAVGVLHCDLRPAHLLVRNADTPVGAVVLSIGRSVDRLVGRSVGRSVWLRRERRRQGQPWQPWRADTQSGGWQCKGVALMAFGRAIDRTLHPPGCVGRRPLVAVR